jgi:hypothetical protein
MRRRRPHRGLLCWWSASLLDRSPLCGYGLVICPLLSRGHRYAGTGCYLCASIERSPLRGDLVVRSLFVRSDALTLFLSVCYILRCPLQEQAVNASSPV